MPGPADVGGVEITESQLQIIALAEEVERLQSALTEERAYREQLRRRFLKLSSPAALAANQRKIADSVQSAGALPVKPAPQSNGSVPLQTPHSASIQNELTATEHVEQMQHPPMNQSERDHASGVQHARQPRQGFSVWAFITGTPTSQVKSCLQLPRRTACAVLVAAVAASKPEKARVACAFVVTPACSQVPSGFKSNATVLMRCTQVQTRYQRTKPIGEPF